MSIFLEKFALALCVAVAFAVIFTNPFGFDRTQRICLGIVVVSLAYFFAHTIKLLQRKESAPATTALSPPSGPTTAVTAAGAISPKPILTTSQPNPREFVSVGPADLTALFKGTTDIQAQTLIAPFKGKWMRISREVYDVKPVPGDGVAVYFESPPLPRMSLFFTNDPRTIERLGIAKRGDRITAVGRIKAVSAEAVHLEDCELE